MVALSDSLRLSFAFRRRARSGGGRAFRALAFSTLAAATTQPSSAVAGHLQRNGSATVLDSEKWLPCRLKRTFCRCRGIAQGGRSSLGATPAAPSSCQPLRQVVETALLRRPRSQLEIHTRRATRAPHSRCRRPADTPCRISPSAMPARQRPARRGSDACRVSSSTLARSIIASHSAGQPC